MQSRTFRALPFVVLVLLLIPVVVFARPLGDEPTAGPSLAPAGGGPSVLVSEDVQRHTVQNAKVWWWYTLPCAPTAPTAPESAGAFRVEEIARIATTGGITRTVFAHDVNSPVCGQWAPEFLSNVTADDDHLYWMSDEYDGLVQLSVEANVGDEPDLLYDGQSQADEIEERGGYVYLMDDAYGILRVNKSTGAEDPIINATQLGGPSRDLQVTDQYVYWNQSGFLKVAGISGGGTGIITGVTDHIAENSLCPPGGPCPGTEYTFFAQGKIIRRYNLDNTSFSTILYDSPVPGSIVDDMTVDEDNIYFFEAREAGCNPFCTYDYGLYRIDRSGGSPDLLYYLTGQLFSSQSFDLTLGGPGNDYLFWNDSGQLKRLPRDAAAIPAVDVSITDVEVTQSIQDLNQSVDLIRDKRTGVRVHVDAAGQNVAGIPARLYRINSVGTVLDGPIYPSAGTSYLTVPNNPNRSVFDHAFYFELPDDWIDGSTVRLRAQINPNQIPPEPSYSNNVMSTPVFTLLPSPTLRSHLIVWGYTVDGNYYQPNTVKDVWQARSWIRRVYPLASTPGGYDSPDPGFRMKVRTINDPNLGGHVERTSDFCLDIPAEDREFCAAAYANNYAKSLRGTEGIPSNELIYSMIWEEPSLPFPRGFASGDVSAGPTGRGTWGWDNDDSYGDWYMGHELGHNAGRAHPDPASDNPATDGITEGCGHSRSDPNFPYANAAIGNGSMWGFDVGDIGLNGLLDPRVYPNSTWRDMMSYCNNQWISDYTYGGIYDFLINSLNAAGDSVAQAPVARAGSSYLALFGAIYDDSDTAAFQVVGLWDSPGPYAAPAGGPYRMRLLDGGGGELASYDFAGDATDANPGNYLFEVVVPFPVGTAEVELRRISDDQVLATHPISANPPTVSGVELAGASSPVTGTVNLQWQASDPDGDPLSFDVYYTDDNGATYTAYALGLSTTSAALDSSQLGGSTQARFRVTANDGARMAEAESPTFTMANKPPTVTILTPQDGFEVTYGTAVNFVAEVSDVQGHVPDASMQWYVNGAATGITGPNYTAFLLPVGANAISLRAVNGVGQITEQGVTVIVNDDLAYPGPTLAVGPDQVAWQLESGSTALQQGTLTISNIGTGALSWTASEDAGWLSLSPAGGDAPGSLTLTADPTKLDPGVPAGAMVTISGDNGQSVQVPVSLLVGVSPIWGDDPDALYRINLPIIH